MGTKRHISNGKKTGNSPVLKKLPIAHTRSASEIYRNVIDLNDKTERETRRIIQGLLSPMEQKLSKSLSTSMPDMSRISRSDSDHDSDHDTENEVKEGRGRSLKEESPKKNFFIRNMFRFSTSNNNKNNKKRVVIGSPDDLCCVSQIVEFDELPKNVRRIRLCKRESDPNFGLYIRNGYINSGTEQSAIRQPGVFVSRFIAGGLAERSGLLSVNDEIIDINGDKVEGKPLTDVYQLMLSNTKEMVLTIKPGDLQTPAT